MSGTLPYRFFLGGHDLEMREIRALLDRRLPGRVEDAGLAWGARASAYEPAIAAALARGETPVLVELEDDLPPTFDRARLVVVDHHGARAGYNAPTSLEQVFALLGLTRAAWTRRMALVAANDRAHLAGLRAAGATAEEMRAIRAADRAAQGVTSDDEVEALRAIAARQEHAGFTEVSTRSTTSSAVADLMQPELGGPGYRALLVRMPCKLAAYAEGAAVARLAAAFPGSYWGGDLPVRGFWGTDLPEDATARDADIARAREALAPGY